MLGLIDGNFGEGDRSVRQRWMTRLVGLMLACSMLLGTTACMGPQKRGGEEQTEQKEEGGEKKQEGGEQKEEGGEQQGGGEQQQGGGEQKEGGGEGQGGGGGGQEGEEKKS